MIPDSGVACQLVPVALAYCTVQPVTSTGAVPALYSSTKSLVQVAPELPPPPYTSETTTSADAASAVVAGSRQPATASVEMDAMSAARVRDITFLRVRVHAT